MAEPLRARAGVVQSLMATLQKLPPTQSERILAALRGVADGVARLPGIGWVDEATVTSILDVCHRELGAAVYTRVIHDACVRMLTTGVVRAARAASDMFVKPSIAGYARWTTRVWALCFQGLLLEYGDRGDDGIRMYLRQPPAGRFSRPIVLGAAGVLQTVFTLAKKPGKVHVPPFRESDERVLLLLQKEELVRSASYS